MRTYIDIRVYVIYKLCRLNVTTYLEQKLSEGAVYPPPGFTPLGGNLYEGFSYNTFKLKCKQFNVILFSHLPYDGKLTIHFNYSISSKSHLSGQVSQTMDPCWCVVLKSIEPNHYGNVRSLA